MDEVDREKELGKKKRSLYQRNRQKAEERDDDKQTHAPCTLNPRD